MKVRAITVGFNLTTSEAAKRIEKHGRFVMLAKKIFEDSGYEVQTRRVASQPWPEYLADLSVRNIITQVESLELLCSENNIDFISIGTAYEPSQIRLSARILESTVRVSCSATIAHKSRGYDHDATMSAAWVMKRIAKTIGKGEGNFRFAAIANCPPDIPFFPASFHRGRNCFTIALESSDLIVKAFSTAHGFSSAEKRLALLMDKEYRKIEKIARRVEKHGHLFFRGIDVSPAPSTLRKGSIAYAFERLGQGEFGAPGTLAIARMITRILRSIRVRQCGFSGLMLPVMEDFGLARRISNLDIDKLLVYSAVCGTGLDCVPLPGDVRVRKICNILHDVAILALHLDKPLSARLLPMPGKRAGSWTDIDLPYLINCQIPSIK